MKLNARFSIVILLAIGFIIFGNALDSKLNAKRMTIFSQIILGGTLIISSLTQDFKDIHYDDKDEFENFFYGVRLMGFESLWVA